VSVIGDDDLSNRNHDSTKRGAAMKDFPINHSEDEKRVNRNIDEQTSGHLKVRDLDDEKRVNRNIDEQTSGHVLTRTEDGDDESTEGHTLRRRRGLDDADESTEGHKR
jgi:hypothetical protein